MSVSKTKPFKPRLYEVPVGFVVFALNGNGARRKVEAIVREARRNGGFTHYVIYRTVDTARQIACVVPVDLVLTRTKRRTAR